MSSLRKTDWRKALSVASIAVVLALSMLTSLALQQNKPANALVSGADWQAGRIIDDDIFYNGDSMTVQEIQAFLDGKVPVCDTNGTQMYNGSMTNAQYAASRGWPGPAYVCLKDYYQVPRSDQNINNLSSNVIPSGAISAAQIIKNAASTYNISPKALLVTLEKESLNLLKDNWPLPNQYRNPMGYGCPDTAPCDPQYEGFYNQMMNAARQFKLYKDNPGSYRYKPFQDNTISYQANAPSCGASTVYISNYATAGLYNYTPYQPNQAALNNMYGTGDACSAYGNRNFWRIFSDWFGSPTVPKSTAYIADGTYMIKSAAADRFIDVTGGSTGNGTRTQIYTGNGSGAQLWQTTRLDNGYYMIKNVGSGRYLDVSNASITNGAPVQIFDGNGGCAQQWAAVSVGNAISLINACSGKALDIPGGNFNNSTKLQIYTRNYSSAQLWTLTSQDAPVLNNGYYKVSVPSNLMITPSSSDSSTHIATDATSDTQTWQFHRQLDGNYRIRNKVSNRFLTATNNGEHVGAQVESHTTNNACSQEWLPEANQDGSYTIRSACSGYAFDVTGGYISTAGTKLQLWDSNGTDAQKWRLTHVGGGVYQISSMLGNKAVDLANASTSNATGIQIWTPNSTCAQGWQVIDNGDNTYTLASACDTTKVLDVVGGHVWTNGSKIQLYGSNSSYAQKWLFSALGQ